MQQSLPAVPPPPEHQLQGGLMRFCTLLTASPSLDILAYPIPTPEA